MASGSSSAGTRSRVSQALLYTAAFLFLVTWVLSIASTSLSDWIWLWTTTLGPHEGLWSTCWSDLCVPANQYSRGCWALLNTVRAFSILTIIFGFLTMALVLAMVSRDSAGLWASALISAILTVIFSVLPWSIYLGFTDQCVISGVTKGAGWCLAVAAFPVACVGLFLLLLWVALRLSGWLSPFRHPSHSSSATATAAAGAKGYPTAAAATYTYAPAPLVTEPFGAAPAVTYTMPSYPTYTTAAPAAPASGYFSGGAPVYYYGGGGPTPAATPMLSF